MNAIFAILFTSVCMGKEMESSDLTTWHKLACVRNEKKRDTVDGGKGVRRE